MEDAKEQRNLFLNMKPPSLFQKRSSTEILPRKQELAARKARVGTKCILPPCQVV